MIIGLASGKSGLNASPARRPRMDVSMEPELVVYGVAESPVFQTE